MIIHRSIYERTVLMGGGIAVLAEDDGTFVAAELCPPTGTLMASTGKSGLAEAVAVWSREADFQLGEVLHYGPLAKALEVAQ